LPLDQFHSQKVDAAGFLHRKDGYDVRVVEGGDGASFTLEAGEAIWIARHLGGKHLESHVTAELGVGGAIHFSHPAGTDSGDDLIMRERASEQIEPPARQQMSGGNLFPAK
jgi:hypothetical protein